jgi:hypothetical protein
VNGLSAYLDHQIEEFDAPGLLTMQRRRAAASMS